jgi:uncharacterized membrane protein
MTYHDTIGAAEALHHLPRVRAITPRDLLEVLAKGFDDFCAMPTHAVFLCLVYPIAGLVIAHATFGYGLLPLLYPLATGFALVGPVAAIGIYELSRRREAGLDADWTHAFDLFQAESFRAILALGLILLAIFGLWIAAANAIYVAHFGYASPESIGAFAREVLTTDAGHRMILVGNVTGFLFALVAFSISVVAFPLLLDRKISATAAIATSVKAVLHNPLTMALWGLTVAALLLIGSLPFFIGLAVVIPVLGHATWHLYRKVVVRDLPPREHRPSPPKGRRYAADFLAALFPVYERKTQAKKATMVTSRLLPAETNEEGIRALGNAVARIWSRLPQDIQHHLFEEAVASQGESVRQQLAVFLHHKHPRTSDSIKARAMPEPDSLGG